MKVQRVKVYEGKAKILYRASQPGTLIQHYKDDTTAFDGAKKAVLKGKGELNCAISSAVFTYLEAKGVKTHFIKRLSANEVLVKECEIIPVEVVVRNISAGSFSRRYKVPEGTLLKEPLVEYFYKSDELHDPLVCPNHIFAFGWAKEDELKSMTDTALKVNALLKELFDRAGIVLVDFKLEFGRCGGELLLADEITPDSCRLWDRASGNILDKDRFRKDLGNLVESYREVLRRIEEALGEGKV